MGLPKSKKLFNYFRGLKKWERVRAEAWDAGKILGSGLGEPNPKSLLAPEQPPPAPIPPNRVKEKDRRT